MGKKIQGTTTDTAADVWCDASLLVDEVLQDVRVDLENADLSEVASTAARMTLEMVSRLWYERKEIK